MTLDDPVAEATRLLDLAEERGVALRAVGGIAVGLRCPSLTGAQPPRVFHDIDLAALRRDSRDVSGLLEAEGYEPHRRFNALAGTRLIFADPERERRIDVFLDVMEMCHTLEFGGGLGAERRTVPLADLLLSKLQVVQLTDRDVVDVAAILADHPLANGMMRGPEEIDVGRILEVCCRDWGWWRTVTGNLKALDGLWADAGEAPGPDRRLAAERAHELHDLLERSPKSARWRARAVVGERVTWYQDPEEIRG